MLRSNHYSEVCCTEPSVRKDAWKLYLLRDPQGTEQIKEYPQQWQTRVRQVMADQQKPPKNPPNEAKFCIFLGYLGSLGLAEAIFRFCRVFCLICQLHGGPADSRADQVRQIMAGFN